MKKLIFAAALLIGCTLNSFAQEVAKTGLNFGPLPAVGYSSDLGWHYGALTDIYWYGDGSTYPEYRWKGNLEISRYSKGNTVLHSFFDSKYLIPGLRVSASVSYFGNNTYSFYGFNGASSQYVPELDQITDAGLGFFIMKRDIFRVMTCLQGTFGDSHWGWAGGISYWNMKTGHAKNGNLTDGTTSLYDLYVDSGVIPEAEKNGGQHLEFKAGIVYDTRDHENNPSRGCNLELYAFGSPDIISHHNNHYIKVAAHWKQFFPLVQDRLTFGYHLAFQGLVYGNAPFYLLQTIQSVNMKQINTEGLGSTCTVRGTAANRLMGNSYAWSNFELRWSFVRFRWINQNWTLATNPFFDAGMIVKPYNLEAQKAAAGKFGNQVLAGTDYKLADLLYTGNAEKLHMGAGIGLHVLMNQNFNISFEVAKCLDPNDGNIGINVGLNYIF